MENDEKISYVSNMPLYKHTNVNGKLIVAEEDKLCNQCVKKGSTKKCYGKTHEIYDATFNITNKYNFEKISKDGEPDEYLSL